MNKKINNKLNNIICEIIDYFVLVIGSIIFAISVDMFSAPNDIVVGGLTGIATILNSKLGFPIGISVIVMNIPMFIWGTIENGKSFLAKTAFATVFSSIAIDILAPYVTAYKGDVFVASLFGGVVSGIGLALIMYAGGTTGGADIFARNMHNHFPHISMGNFIVFVDMLVVALAGFAYNSIESMLYAIVLIFVAGKVMDTLLYGFANNNGKLMWIISDKYELIRDSMLENIDRGITLLNAQGGYNLTEKKVVLCALRSSQVHAVKRLVLSIDKGAFIIINTADTISGEGFEEKRKYIKKKSKNIKN